MLKLRIPALALLFAALAAGCAASLHTLENTRDLDREELAALCVDLKMRADQDCQWNMEQRQSSLPNQQTWEINCRARRDSARQSYENVCLQSRFSTPVTRPGEE